MNCKDGKKVNNMRLIDADALKDGYMHMGYDPNEHPEESYMEGWCKGFNAAVDHCIGHVIHAPTIEPERKTGKWIYHKDWDDDGECGYECSECGMGSEVNYNYCMRCGAKMEEGDHS
jgi:hypothetical protein